MGFVKWLGRFFNKKGSEQKKKKIEEESLKAGDKNEPVILFIGDKEDKKTKEEKSGGENKDFKNLLENLEKNRSSIIKSLEENKPKTEEYEDRVEYTLKGAKFIFCKEGYKLFQEEFKNKNYDIFVSDGYLARQHKKTESIDYFHRWFMKDEAEEFAEANGCSVEDVHVHHIDLTATNNKRENLKAMAAEEYSKLTQNLK